MCVCLCVCVCVCPRNHAASVSLRRFALCVASLQASYTSSLRPHTIVACKEMFASQVARAGRLARSQQVCAGRSSRHRALRLLSTRAFPSCWLAAPALRQDWQAASTLLPTWLTSLCVCACQSTRVTCAAEGYKKGAGPQIRLRRRRGALSFPFLACPLERRQGIDGGGEGVRPTT